MNTNPNVLNEMIKTNIYFRDMVILNSVEYYTTFGQKPEHQQNRIFIVYATLT